MINQAPRLWHEAALLQSFRRLLLAQRRRLPTIRWQRWLTALWWPIEVGNDLHQLTANVGNRPFPTYVRDRDATDLLIIVRTIQQRIRWQRGLLLVARGLWLALLVSLILLLGRFVTSVPWFVVGLGALAVVALAGLYGYAHRVTVWSVARLVDRHWRLHEQVSTALELAISPPTTRLAPDQISRALETVRAERQQRRLRVGIPWAELQLTLALGLLVAGLSLASGPSERLTPPSALLSPETAATVDLSALGLQESGEMVMSSDPYVGAINDDYGMAGFDSSSVDFSGLDAEALRETVELSRRSAQELGEIASALKDASVTSGAAQSLEAGEYSAAAEQIADLAKSVENLSPEARRDLAERLKTAAQNVQPMDPELARRLDQASKALASRSDRAAQQGLEDLSKAIADTGKNVLPQAALGAAMDDVLGGESGTQGADDGPARSGSTPDGMDGQGALGEGDAGQYGFGSAEGTLSIGANTGTIADDGSGGSGAGRGTGPDNERYTPRTNPNADRVEVRTDTGSGPSAQRPGRTSNGQPDIITTGPGATGPGQQVQTGLPISTGLDGNRVPRPLRSVVEGYFRNQSAPSAPPAQAPR